MNAGFTTHRVLVTGGAGAVGRVVCRALRERGLAVSSFDRRAVSGVDTCHVGDLTDAAAVEAAIAGTDTIIHLGGTPNPADFVSDLVPNNIVGTFHVFEAAVRQHVSRVILASTLQVAGGVQRHPGQPLRLADGTASRNLYAVSKVCLEEMARMYALTHKLSTLAVRIGWFPRNAGEVANMQSHPGAHDIYLSPADCGRFFCAAVEVDAPAAGNWAIVFLTSRPLHGAGLDLDPARQITGYVPLQVWPEGVEEVGAS